VDDSGKVWGGIGMVGGLIGLIGSVGRLLGISRESGGFCGCYSCRFSGISTTSWGSMGGLFSGGFC
jgi:hypothetical protein